MILSRRLRRALSCTGQPRRDWETESVRTVEMGTGRQWISQGRAYDSYCASTCGYCRLSQRLNVGSRKQRHAIGIVFWRQTLSRNSIGVTPQRPVDTVSIKVKYRQSCALCPECPCCRWPWVTHTHPQHPIFYILHRRSYPRNGWR